MKNNNGFTLVELLAVVVILAVIAIISLPLIIGVIENTKKAAVKNSLHGISEAADLYYFDSVEKDLSIGAIINVTDGTLDYKGKVDKGSLIFNDEGKTKVIISLGNYCAYKDYDSNIQLGIVENNNCNINDTLINLETLDIGETELILMVSSTSDVPVQAGIDNEIRLISNVEVSNYLISNTEPSTKNNGTVWIKIDLTSTNYITMENTYIPISEVKQYDGSKWNSKDAYIYNSTAWAKISNEIYKETILNETDPVLGTGMIPVIISNDGTVKYADVKTQWYNYENKIWANAVILSSGTYNVGDTILESSIQSYFVWIPRYKYKLWNTGTSIKTKHSIEIVFENNTTSASNGSTNNSWLTHPSFTTLNTNGFWVGKYETGYLGATSLETAQVTSSDQTKIIVKPNVYSWRNNSVYNMFLSSYNYNRSSDSHMMKNTEWGAVAYLSHSIYGINNEININNNSSYKTGYSALPSTSQQTYPGIYGDGGTYNNAYNTEIGYLASTTGNITGIYDMSGGAWEYVSAYVSGQFGSSGFTSANIATYNSKYFDVYNASSTPTTYNYRILGDATGEVGPFLSTINGAFTGYTGSWYNDYSYFIDASLGPCLARGGFYNYGTLASQFAFANYSGAIDTRFSSRLILAP